MGLPLHTTVLLFSSLHLYVLLELFKPSLVCGGVVLKSPTVCGVGVVLKSTVERVVRVVLKPPPVSVGVVQAFTGTWCWCHSQAPAVCGVVVVQAFTSTWCWSCSRASTSMCSWSCSQVYQYVVLELFRPSLHSMWCRSRSQASTGMWCGSFSQVSTSMWCRSCPSLSQDVLLGVVKPSLEHDVVALMPPTVCGARVILKASLVRGVQFVLMPPQVCGVGVAQAFTSTWC